MNLAAKRLPPFARRLSPRDKCIWLFTGPSAWEWAANDTRNKLLLPPEHDPVHFRWPVTDKDVVIVDTGSSDAYLRRIAWALLNAGALRVGCIPSDASLYVVFARKAVRHAA